MGRLLAVLMGGMMAVPGMVLSAQAQDFPSRTVTLINPYAAGGGVDITNRIIESVFARELGGQVVIDYRSGGNGFVGASYVATAAPDGYTLLTTPSGPILNTLGAEISYDPKTAFQPISRTVSTPAFLVVPEASPIKTVADLVALGKDPSKSITFAHSGNGTGTHMAAGLFALMTETKFTGVPYRGTGPQVTDLVAGVVDFVFLPAADTLSRLGSGGGLRALAVTTAERSPLAPDVPTLDESGVKGYEFSQWYGWFAPAGTPAPVVEKLNKALVATLNDEGVKEKLMQLGVVPGPTTPEEFAEIIRENAESDQKIASSLGLIKQ